MNFDFDDIPCQLGVVACVVDEMHAQLNLELVDIYNSVQIKRIILKSEFF